MTGKLFAGAAASLLLLSACGSDPDAGNNAAELDAHAAGGVPLGNDASAMEIVGSQGGGAASLSAPAEGNGVAPSGNNSGSRGSGSGTGTGGGDNGSRTAPPPTLGPGTSAPGGDQGGNSATGNISGI